MDKYETYKKISLFLSGVPSYKDAKEFCQIHAKYIKDKTEIKLINSLLSKRRFTGESYDEMLTKFEQYTYVQDDISFYDPIQKDEYKRLFEVI